MADKKQKRTVAGRRPVAAQERAVARVSKKTERPVAINNPCTGCEMNCVTCVRNEAQVLRQAACLTMKEKSAEFTTSLWQSALKGNTNCAKMLLAVVGKRPEKVDTKKNRPDRSLAINLAAQPEWQEPEAREEVGAERLAEAG